MAVSCSASTDATTTSLAEVVSTSTGAVAIEGDLAGQIVVLDSIGNVIVMDPDGSNAIQITDDAGVDRFYTQPTWSPRSGVLGWGQLSEEGFGVGLANVEDGGRSVLTMSGLPFYLHFSPTGEYLALLNNGQDGLDFSVVDVDQTLVSVSDQGSPFYFSWKPDGSLVALHEGESRFEVLDPTNGDRTQMGPTDVGYLAPQWGPEGILHISGGDLVVQDLENMATPLADVLRFTPFVANPQGTLVALQTTGNSIAISAGLAQATAIPRDSLVVVDVVTGEFDVVDSALTIGFFWSPDGRSLLVLQPGNEAGEIRPVVWNIDGSVAEFPSFHPSPLLVSDVLPFFAQYAQSLRFWSPDSRAFAYPTRQGVFVQRLADGEPTRVSSGLWVAWSHS